MLSIEARLSQLVDSVRNLLGCEGVELFLGCPDPILRHPLLKFLPYDYAMALRCDVVSRVLPYFHERLWAVCDIASQTGRMWCIEHTDAYNPAVKSVAAVPIGCSHGMLGLMLLSDTHVGAFSYGECWLIEQYVPTLAQALEEILFDVVTTACAPATKNSRVDENDQSELIAVVSHELRLPLTAIKGYGTLLQEYGWNEHSEDAQTPAMTVTRQRKYLDAMLTQTKHLEVLVNDLLDLSRMQKGRLTLRCSHVDLVELCQRVAQLIQLSKDQQFPGYYHIHCEGDPHLPLLWADPHRIQQVLTNLVENAVKYSPNGGQIKIRVYAQHDSGTELEKLNNQDEQNTCSAHYASSVCVTVRDWGIGIPRQLQPALFKPFSRVESSFTKHVPGAGLGLYISRKLVEAMGGQMYLESNEGDGTCVTFTLPIECMHSGCTPYLPLMPYEKGQKLERLNARIVQT